MNSAKRAGSTTPKSISAKDGPVILREFGEDQAIAARTVRAYALSLSSTHRRRTRLGTDETGRSTDLGDLATPLRPSLVSSH